MEPVRVIVAAAYGSTRAGLRAMLEGDAGLAVIGDTGGDWDTVLSALHPDAVVADDGPAFDRAGLVRAAAEATTAVVLLGDEESGAAFLAAVGLPGWAALLRDADGAQIAAAARAVAAGLVVLDRSLAASALPLSRPALDGETGEALTGRERDVLQLLAQGLPNKQIAARLGVSPHTVKFHVASLLAKFGASSRTEAVTRGARRGDIFL